MTPSMPFADQLAAVAALVSFGRATRATLGGRDG